MRIILRKNLLNRFLSVCFGCFLFSNLSMLVIPVNILKVLRYDCNGFVLATKKLLDDMKFQWPKTADEVKEITFQQVEWLLQGLEIEQKKAHHQVNINVKNCCF